MGDWSRYEEQTLFSSTGFFMVGKVRFVPKSSGEGRIILARNWKHFYGVNKKIQNVNVIEFLPLYEEALLLTNMPMPWHVPPPHAMESNRIFSIEK